MLLGALSANECFPVTTEANSVQNGIAADFAVNHGFLICAVFRIELHPDDLTAEGALNLKLGFHRTIVP